MSSEISVKILNANFRQTNEQNAVELMNRYFDVMTVQKSMTKLLTDGISLVLKTVVGLLLLAFYHPYFLIFDLLLIVLLILVWKVYGRYAITSAIYESKAKYKVASWLEELARANFFFKSQSKKKMAIEKSDELIYHYLAKRKTHFKHLFSQKIFLLSIYAIMSALVLGLGGYLVIIGELSLGQLVAAELIITVILSSLSNSAKYLESFYDLYAAVDKLSSFHDLEAETELEEELEQPFVNFDLILKKVRVHNGKYNLYYDYHFESGCTYLIESKVYSSKQIFLNLIQSLAIPDEGTLSLGDKDYATFSPNIFREEIQVASKPMTFEGTIRDNLSWGNKSVKDSDIRLALKKTFLEDSLVSFKEGLDTPVLPSGFPFWSSQLLRFEVARAMVNKPQVLILTEVFDQVEEKRMKAMIEELQKLKIIIIYITNKNSDNYLFKDKLKLDEQGLRRYEDE
jgi:putative ABC transport system ATP-binding protein